MLSKSTYRNASRSPATGSTRCGKPLGAPVLHESSGCQLMQSRCCRPARRPSFISRAVSGSSSKPEGEDYGKVAADLNRLLSRTSINGQQLREMVIAKWGRSYECRLRKTGRKMYFEVMWKYLEQASFPLTSDQYMQQLDAVAEYLTEWGVVETVRQGVMASNNRGPGYTGGAAARSIIVPLDVDLTGSRKSEWR